MRSFRWALSWSALIFTLEFRARYCADHTWAARGQGTSATRSGRGQLGERDSFVFQQHRDAVLHRIGDPVVFGHQRFLQTPLHRTAVVAQQAPLGDGRVQACEHVRARRVQGLVGDRATEDYEQFSLHGRFFRQVSAGDFAKGLAEGIATGIATGIADGLSARSDRGSGAAIAARNVMLYLSMPARAGSSG